MESVLLWIAVSTFSYVQGSIEVAFTKVMKSPNRVNLEQFKKKCRPPTNLGFESNTDVAKWLDTKKIHQKEQIEALIYSYLNCSDGASSEAVNEFLGSKVLVEKPYYFFKVLKSLKPKLADIKSVLHQDTEEVRFLCDPSAECTSSQRQQVYDFWLSKKEALEKLASDDKANEYYQEAKAYTNSQIDQILKRPLSP